MQFLFIVWVINIQQETKIQEEAVDKYRNLLEGYESYWNCSTVKKGYAGTAVFLKKGTVNIAPISTTASASTVVHPPKKQSTLTSMWKSSVAKTSSQTSTSTDTTDVTNHHSGNVSGASDGDNGDTSVPVVTAQRISMDFEDETKRFHGEGRTITIEFDSFILVACYVPNSGEGLVRLNYRVQEWLVFVHCSCSSF